MWPSQVPCSGLKLVVVEGLEPAPIFIWSMAPCPFSVLSATLLLNSERPNSVTYLTLSRQPHLERMCSSTRTWIRKLMLSLNLLWLLLRLLLLLCIQIGSWNFACVKSWSWGANVSESFLACWIHSLQSCRWCQTPCTLILDLVLINQTIYQISGWSSLWAARACKILCATVNSYVNLLATVT